MQLQKEKQIQRRGASTGYIKSFEKQFMLLQCITYVYVADLHSVTSIYLGEKSYFKYIKRLRKYPPKTDEPTHIHTHIYTKNIKILHLNHVFNF